MTQYVLGLKSGKVLWMGQVDSPAVSVPAVYTYKGKEYVVFAVGGNSILEPKVADQLVAFTLPDCGTAVASVLSLFDDDKSQSFVK